MEIEININNIIFTKLYLKIRVRAKEISNLFYQSKSINYSKCEYLPDKNSDSSENMFFLR